MSTLHNLKYPLWKFQEWTSNWRVLPDFIILGAQKGGTTSLYGALAQHPSIPNISRRDQEIHFFDLAKDYKRGIRWYRGQFPTVFNRYCRQKIFGSAFAAGEASPYYLFHPHAPKRAARHLKTGTKFIVLLRDPAVRAYSHYQHEVRKGREDRSFEEALVEEREKLPSELERMLKDENYDSPYYRNSSYLERGVYLPQLKRWLQYFPQENFLIMKSERFFQETDRAYQEILNFLGLPLWRPASFEYLNKGIYSAAVEPSLLNRLREFYRVPNERLSEFLGSDFTWQDPSAP